MLHSFLSLYTEVKGHLYFVLNGVTYQHNSTVSITQIGCFDRATGYDNADASLMCVTDQVNTNCCREQDGGNMGEWYFPNGSMIPRERESHSNFSRSGFLMQVRLNRKNEAMGPLGTYKCKVPRMDGCGGKLHMHVASVIIGQYPHWVASYGIKGIIIPSVLFRGYINY